MGYRELFDCVDCFADVVPQYPFPESKSTTYSQHESPITDWMLEHWAAAGYAVPEDGEHSVWRTDVVAVTVRLVGSRKARGVSRLLMTEVNL
jgi:hypothetical protein